MQVVKIHKSGTRCSKIGWDLRVRSLQVRSLRRAGRPVWDRLALGLLATLVFGGAGSPAWAQVPFHQEILAGFSSLKAEADSKPVTVDLDGDGDLDLVVGSTGPNPIYFENLGSPTSPRFVERRGDANPIAGITTESNVSLDFGDLDGDGDLDAVVGDDDGTLSYFENVGDSTVAVFEARPLDNPFDFVDVGEASDPELVDVDGDGDLDAFVGRDFLGLAFLENIGSPASPSFVELQGFPDHPLYLSNEETAGVDLSDVDGDGDFDAVIGGATGLLTYYENFGSATAPDFVLRTGGANPFDGVDTIGGSKPQLADLDGDGDLDAILGEGFGSFQYYENLGDANTPSLVKIEGRENPLAGHRQSSFSNPELADLDGDGDLDAVLAAGSSFIGYFENTGSAVNPLFRQRTGGDNPFDSIDVGGGVSVDLADFDADGDLDALLGATSGVLTYFENIGNAQSPVFEERTDGDNPFGGIFGLQGGSPELFDLDGDSDLDALVAVFDGTIRTFENTGTPQNPLIVELTGADNPLDGVDLDIHLNLDALDFDRDGDVDLMAGIRWGRLVYFENTGSPETAVFEQVTVDSPVDGIDVGSLASPKMADLDGDGDLDALVGEFFGRFIFYRSTAVEPLFVDGFESGDTSAWTVTSPGS